MKIPVMQGVIDRRILANFRIDTDVLDRMLPSPFRPKLIGGKGIGGICLIRLKHLRPRFVPAYIGFTSENAAHRFAVLWDQDGETREGVYIPRRDTSSRLTTFLGGRLFPGFHHHARFQVDEKNDRYSIIIDSDDDDTHMAIDARTGHDLPDGSVFESMQEASDFFENGSLGYSATRTPGSYDGLELRTLQWEVESLAVDRIESSFFEDRQYFPKGSVEFDYALLMRNIQHQWHGQPLLCAPSTARSQ